MTQKQYETITAWQDKVFTKATPLSCANHFEEEAKELRESIETGNVDKSEIADCFLLLIGICNKYHMRFEDVVNMIDAKMEVNYQRKWGTPNEKGYVKHIEIP